MTETQKERKENNAKPKNNVKKKGVAIKDMIHHQNVFEPWPIEDETIQAIITSPPYYALRKYNIEDIIIGGDKDCKHEFGSESIERKRGNKQEKDGKRPEENVCVKLILFLC